MESIPQPKPYRPGRPVGSTLFNRESFLQHAIEAYRKIMSRHEKHPAQYDVAAELLIARATLNRYLVSYSISWGDIRQLAMQK